MHIQGIQTAIDKHIIPRVALSRSPHTANSLRADGAARRPKPLPPGAQMKIIRRRTITIITIVIVITTYMLLLAVYQYMHIYIYIYICRERERDIYIYIYICIHIITSIHVYI